MFDIDTFNCVAVSTFIDGISHAFCSDDGTNDVSMFDTFRDFELTIL